MKQCNYIAVIENKDFKQIGFERFSCKKPETVKNKMLALFQNDLYKVCTPGAVSVAIYATPDGYNRENAPCICFNIKGV